MLGLALLTARGLIPAKAGWNRFNESVQDVLRDLGIAFIVSSVVAVFFELYRSLHHQIQSMRDVIDAVMADKLTKDVWFELQDLIDKKSVMRKGLHIRIQAYRDKLLQPHEAKLRVELGYVLVAIGRKRLPIKLSHDLDYHIGDLGMRLPRFERISIVRLVEGGPDSASEEMIFEEPELSESNRKGRFESPPLEPLHEGEYLRIRVVREELAHIPGSYNLYNSRRFCRPYKKGLPTADFKFPDDSNLQFLLTGVMDVTTATRSGENDDRALPLQAGGVPRRGWRTRITASYRLISHCVLWKQS